MERRRARGLVLVEDAAPICARVGAQRRGCDFLAGRNPALSRSGARSAISSAIQQRLAAMRADTTPPDKRLADNMLDFNPAATDALVRLMWGALVPGREGGLLNARLRYFDPAQRAPACPRTSRRSCRSSPTRARP